MALFFKSHAKSFCLLPCLSCSVLYGFIDTRKLKMKKNSYRNTQNKANPLLVYVMCLDIIHLSVTYLMCCVLYVYTYSCERQSPVLRPRQAGTPSRALYTAIACLSMPLTLHQTLRHVHFYLSLLLYRIVSYRIVPYSVSLLPLLSSIYVAYLLLHTLS